MILNTHHDDGPYRRNYTHVDHSIKAWTKYSQEEDQVTYMKQFFPFFILKEPTPTDRSFPKSLMVPFDGRMSTNTIRGLELTIIDWSSIGR